MSTHKIRPSMASGTDRNTSIRLSKAQAPVLVSPPTTKQKILMQLDSKAYTTIMGLFTMYALFADDIRLAATPITSDYGFFFISTIALVLFTLEFLVNCYCQDAYIGGFYFWLDFAATISLIPDIGWIWDVLIETLGDSENSTAALKAGKASKAGARAGRIVKIVRLVRMVRIVKLYKISKGDATGELDTQIKNEPSKVGKKMSEMTTRKVILIILLLVLMLPIFDGGIEEKINEFQPHGLRELHILASRHKNPANDDYIQRLTETYAKDAGSIIHLKISNIPSEISDAWVTAGSSQKPSTEPSISLLPSPSAVFKVFRQVELKSYSYSGCYQEQLVQGVTSSEEECTSIVFFDVGSQTRYSATMGIVKTFFVMCALAVSAVMFAKIAEVLVITPIERMMNLIKRLAENPLASTNIEGEEFQSDKKAKEEGYETALLEQTLKKIGALMQVGFGAAGADVIGKNMGSGDLDPMLPGKKITAIYGFCDIRQFTDTTECLQEEVMVYVNKLGDIMHGDTHSYYGMANKNAGDAFLLSWKICDGCIPGFSQFYDKPTEETRISVNEKYVCVPNAGSGAVARRISPTEMADSALTAFLKCIIDLDNANTKGTLTEYLTHERVLRRFGEGFRIRMGFGMHVGWAIEGAIGTRFKIDATYISPHVEMADRLEAGSKMFKQPLNMSQWFVALLSPSARKFLRPMDCLKIKGVDVPLTVYTFDVLNMKLDFGIPKVDPETKKQIPVDFENDKQYKEIQEGLHPGFIKVFTDAFNAYIKGDWSMAKVHLETAEEFRPNDGPKQNLWGIMSAHDFVAPENWQGYRIENKY